MFSLLIPASPSPGIPPATDCRHVRLVQPIEGDLPGQIQISCGSRLVDYQIDPVATDPEFRGQAYLLRKCAPTESGFDSAYHVLLSEQGHSCDCIGFCRWDRCKHVEALLVLKQAGKI